MQSFARIYRYRLRAFSEECSVVRSLEGPWTVGWKKLSLSASRLQNTDVSKGPSKPIANDRGQWAENLRYLPAMLGFPRTNDEFPLG